MPDTAENQALYPQPSGQKPVAASPCSNSWASSRWPRGAFLHAAHGPVRVHDVQLFRQLWGHLTQGDVLLADRGFCSFGLLAALQQRDIDSLLQLHQAQPIDFRRGKRLSKADRQLEWVKPSRCPRTLSAQQFAALPDTLTGRQLRVQPSS